MKKIINYNIITFIVVLVFAFTPFTAFAADMWAETPDLNDENDAASIVTEPATLKYNRPAVNMWAETPDLSADSEDYDVSIGDNIRVVGNFNPEMYTETPDLNKPFEHQVEAQADEAFEDIFTVDK